MNTEINLSMSVMCVFVLENQWINRENFSTDCRWMQIYVNSFFLSIIVCCLSLHLIISAFRHCHKQQHYLLRNYLTPWNEFRNYNLPSSVQKLVSWHNTRTRIITKSIQTTLERRNCCSYARKLLSFKSCYRCRHRTSAILFIVMRHFVKIHK